MKKSVIFFGLALLTLGAVSCKKDYVCDCHSHDDEQPLSEDRKIREYENVTKSEAEDMCADRERHLEEDHGYNDIHCDLK